LLTQPTAHQFARPHASVLTGEATLHVCTIITNPVRYASRYKLYEGFRAQNEGQHIVHWTVEVAYGNRPFVVTERDNQHHVQLRTSSELWHKENALNVLIAYICQICPDAEYFAWVDADVTFVRADWAYETIQQLQHYDFVQMFTEAQDVGPNYEPLGKRFKGFVWAYYNDPRFPHTSDLRAGYTADGHPGFAWAARRKALDAVGGLLDFAVCGGADRHMACGLIGSIELSGPDRLKKIDQLSPEFTRWLHVWQDNAAALNKNIGYVHGLLNHHWHGRKRDRRYGERWKIYTDNGYDPLTDLRRDAQGLWALTERKPRLRDDLRSYFRSRNEDSIDL
jgi:hypothetical protein